MKTKLTFLFAALALSGVSFAGPSDGAAFAMRHAREAAQREQGAVVVANTNQAATYVPSSSGKGLVQTSNGNEQVTNIALFKSSKKTSAGGGACCATKR